MTATDISDQSRDKLVRMVNQIAAFFATQPGDTGKAEIAAHIRAFWDPAMRANLTRHVAAGGAGLTPLARAAAEHLDRP